MSTFHVNGHLGRDAEIRNTANGQTVANLAVVYQYGRKAEGEQYRPSQWVECSLWGKQAEALRNYLVKGAALCLVLRDVHVEAFQKRDGGQGTKLVGTVVEIEFAPQTRQNDSNAATPAPARQQSPRPQPARAAANFDDDIPF